MQKTVLAMLVALLHCGASGAPASPFSFPKKIQGVWADKPASCKGDVVADGSGFEIDAKFIRRLDENCQIAKVKRQSATALTADLRCSWAEGPYPRSMSLSLSADESRLQADDRRYVRCEVPK